MALSDPDLTFANQVDAYISDDDDSTLPSHSQPFSSPQSNSNNFISAPITPNAFNSNSNSNSNNNNNSINRLLKHNASDKLAPFIHKPVSDISTSQPALPHTRPPADAVSPHSSPNPRDSLQINRLRLSRFQHDAESFISSRRPPAPRDAPTAFDTHPSPSRNAADLDLDPDRLARFHAQAVSFLDRAYANDAAVSAPVLQLGDEKLASNSNLAAYALASSFSHERSTAQQRQQQKEMLEQFHSEALHFLDTAAHAALSDPSLSGDRHAVLREPASAPPQKQFGTLRGEDEKSDDKAFHDLHRFSQGDATSLRIARDKARLEEHYRDAMSFLNRPDNDRRMVEEQELESAAVERFQLQKYAREAMSFLDKAFRGDASVMVHDDNDEPSSGNPSPEGAARAAARGAAGARDDDDAAEQDGAGAAKNASDEAGQIAADRAALERYDQEFGHFLSKAYEDDATIIVDDAESETSGTERELYARRMAPSSSSAGTGYSGTMTNDEQLSEDAFTDDEFQGGSLAGAEELASLRNSFPARSDSTSGAPTPIAKQSPAAAPLKAFHDNTIRPPSASPPDDSQDSEAVRSRMARYEREAADYLDGANVSDDEEVVLDNANMTSPPAHTESDSPNRSPPGDFQLDALSTIPFDRDDLLAERRERRAQRPPSMDDSRLMRAHQRARAHPDTPPQHSQYVESRSTSSSDESDEAGLAFGHRDTLVRGSSPPARFIAPPPSARLPDRKAELPVSSPNGEGDATAAAPAHAADSPREHSSRDASSSGSPRSGSREDTGNIKLDMTLEHGSGQKQYREMPIERSFYRQIPRGATIKLRPRMSPPLSASTRTTGTSVAGSEQTAVGTGISPEELRRVEKERDVLMATLEEIVNERSQLAAQVSEMKTMIRAVGDKDDANAAAGTPQKEGPDGLQPDIDLGAELREAHVIMEKMTEEMDETLSVLDGRYQETLQRAHAAEEKCIRLEANSTRQDSQFSAQGARLAAALAEERRLSALLSRTEKEFEELRLKSDSDIQRIQDEYREEGERKMSRIRELTSEVAVLHDRLRDAATGEERQAMLNGSKRLELEVSSLKDKVSDLERQVDRERDSGRRKREKDREALQREADNRLDRVNGELRAAKRAAEEAERLRSELELERSERARAVQRADKAERAKAEVDGQMAQARRAQKVAEVETTEIRSRFEDSVKQRISQMDQTGELVELQSSLQALRDGAAEREGSLQRQLEEFKTRAEQAEQAATAAERGAKEAAEMARLAQERSRAAIDTERQARQEAETDRASIAAEWERFSKKQEEKQRKDEVLVAKSSSRRGLRKSPSKSLKDEKRKKKKDKSERSHGDDGSKAGGSDEISARKKSSHRARIFG